MRPAAEGGGRGCVEFDPVPSEPPKTRSAVKKQARRGLEIARLARMDSQIRVNHLILANRCRVPELNPFLLESCFGGLKIANCRSGAICP